MPPNSQVFMQVRFTVHTFISWMEKKAHLMLLNGCIVITLSFYHDFTRKRDNLFVTFPSNPQLVS